MATDSLRVSATFPVPPADLYARWLSSEGHAELTGAGAEVDGRVGGRHAAWDGYIEGETLELDPGSRIVQSWRTAEFPDGAPDSRLEVLFEAVPEGSRVTLVHTEIPAGQGERYLQGWEEYYFSPMRARFGG